MTQQHSSSFSRRDAMTGALLLGVGNVLGLDSALGAGTTGDLKSDFGFLTGSWRIRHHKLKGRLVGSTEWSDFEGTCKAWPLLGGLANVDDNVLHAPEGEYRGVTIRRRHPDTGKWWIWWLDDKSAGMEPPVIGEFKDGVGTFFGDDELRGQPIRVRFVWSEISARRARWEQAFSADQGRSWEVNWVMQFEREA